MLFRMPPRNVTKVNSLPWMPATIGRRPFKFVEDGRGWL